MAALTPHEALQRLTARYRDAFHCEPPSLEAVVSWADKPEIWAEHQIHRGWSWHACECMVRQCRILRDRARLALAQDAAE